MGNRKSRIALYFSDFHLKEVIRGALSSAALRILGALFLFLLYLIISRMSGPQGIGLFYLGLSLVNIFSVLGRVGLDNGIMRLIASTGGDQGKSKELYSAGFILLLTASFAVTSVAWLNIEWLNSHFFESNDYRWSLTLFVLCTIPLSVASYHGFALQGLKRTAQAATVLSVLTPLSAVVLTPPLIVFLGVDGAAAGYGIACVVCALTSMHLWRRSVGPSPASRNSIAVWPITKICLPLFWISIAQLAIYWSPILLLGFWGSAEDVGIFGNALRLGMLVSFALLSVNAILAPKIAEIYVSGELAEVGRLVRSATRLVMGVATPVILLLLVFTEQIMALFGKDFTSGASVLSVILIGQTVNVFTGSVGHVLIMCGKEKLMRNNVIGCAVLIVVLCVTLIPTYGQMGAAWAVSITLAAQNLIAAILVHRELGIRTIPLPGRFFE